MVHQLQFIRILQLQFGGTFPNLKVLWGVWCFHVKKFIYNWSLSSIISMLQIKSKYFDDLDTADLFFLFLFMVVYEPLWRQINLISFFCHKMPCQWSTISYWSLNFILWLRISSRLDVNYLAKLVYQQSMVFTFLLSTPIRLSILKN